MEENEIKLRFREFCRLHGCKCTPQRFAVFAYMLGNLSHPTVNQVWESVRGIIPYITRESVFRILCELADFGMVSRMDKIESARFDGQTSNHGHLICESCGAIIDFDLPAELQGYAPPAGFQANRVELRLSGLCAQCAEKMKANNNKEKKE